MSIKTTEEHLRDLGPLEVQRRIPGALPLEGREVRYAEDLGEVPFEALFKRIVRHIDPPLMKGGGALVEGCTLTIPTGRRFQALSYRGDIAGWRRQVEEGAAALKVTLGQIVGEEFVLDDRSSYRLTECRVEFD